MSQTITPITSHVAQAASHINAKAPWRISDSVSRRMELKPSCQDSLFKKCLVLYSDDEMVFVEKYFSADKPKGVQIHRVYCIENINSEKAFEPNLSSMEIEAENPQFHPNWSEAQNFEERNEVFQRWQSMVQVFPSFKLEDERPEIHQAKVLPLWLRGKSEELCSILKTSGSIQDISSSLNNPLSATSGSFGDGTYFTNSSRYASLYSPTQLVLAWVSMMEPYPVVHDQPPPGLGRDRGLLIDRQGYQCYNAHHVPVALIDSLEPDSDEYYACYQNHDVTCDEFVVFNQAQRINRFWIELKKEGSNLPYSFNEAMSDAEDGSLNKLKAWLGEDSHRIQQKTQEGETLLYVALYGNQLETIKFLLSKNPSLVEHIRKDGKSLLFLGVLGGRREILNWLLVNQGLAYSREQFEKEAKSFDYSEDRIEKALKSVGWLKPVLPSCPAHVITRKDLLSKLEEKFSGNPYKTFVQASLVGPGGVGKSTLAKFYAREHQNRYSFVFWMKAGESSQSGLKDLGIKLGIVEVDSPELVEADSPENIKVDRQKESLDIVKNYLKNNPGWLLIFDEVKNPSSIGALFYGFKVGHVLITSLDDSASQKIQIGSFSPEESISFLSNYTRNGDEKGAEALAEELGHFPLALTQAAAYIFENSESFSSYFNLYLRERKDLIDHKSDQEEYPYSAASTWKISVDKLRETNPKAILILNRAFYLAPNDIPKCLLGENNLSSEDLDLLLESLRKYSLLTSGIASDTFSVNRLIQTTLKDNLSSLEAKKAKETLQEVFDKEWQFDDNVPNTWLKAKTLLSHLEAFSNVEADDETVWKFLRDIGAYFLKVEIDLTRSIDFLNKALQIQRKVFGKEHSDVADNLNDLGTAYQAQGDLLKAIGFHKESLQITKKVHGKEHPGVAASLNNLGLAYGAQGDFLKAIGFYKESLKITKEVCGEEHPDIAASLNNLGLAYGAQGDFPRAVGFHEKSLKICKKVYEEEHPNVATSLSNLGAAYQDQGDFLKAIEFHEESLKIRKKVYGEKHPSVATSLDKLGSAYHAQGDLLKAIEFHEESLKIRRKVYGEKHPSVANSLNSLGVAYQAQGDLLKAIGFHEESLKIYKEVYGEEHSSVAISLNNLGVAYLAQRDFYKAIQFYVESFNVCKKVYGKKHPSIAISLSNLGTAYEARGDFLKAIGFYEQSLKIRKKLYTKEHPSVAASLSNLGAAYRAQGDFLKAIRFYEQSLKIRKKLYGEEYPSAAVATSLIQLGTVYQAQGDFVKAIEFYKGSLKTYKRVYGKKHLSVATSLNNLGTAYQAKGEFLKAIVSHEKSLEVGKKLYGEQHPSVANSLNSLGAAHQAQGNFLKAIGFYEESLKIYEKLYGEENPSVANSLNNLGAAYQDQGDFLKAIELYGRALEIYEKLYGKDHPHSVNTRNNLLDLLQNLYEG